jgi:ATP-binding cassette subfamily C (CFTR/MRP) protein 1
LYSDADIILLDDPLSAVDSHVGKHLFEKAIQQYWKDKIVILATNQLQYLPYADKVLFLSNGEVVGEGTFQELVESSPLFAEQMLKYGVGGEKIVEEKKDEVIVANEEKAGEPEQSKLWSMCSLKSQSDKFLGGTLVNVEDKQTGLIGWNVYWYYFKRGGAAIFAFVIVFLLIAVTSRVMASWWLTQWTRDVYGLASPTCKLADLEA